MPDGSHPSACRRVASRRIFSGTGSTSRPKKRIFLMFGSANRDASIFEDPDSFRLDRDTSKAISFGAGPHFCAGAAASRCLISEVALPMLFEAFPNIELADETPFGGWAFRGPLKMPVRLGK